MPEELAQIFLHFENVSFHNKQRRTTLLPKNSSLIKYKQGHDVDLDHSHWVYLKIKPIPACWLLDVAQTGKLKAL